MGISNPTSTSISPVSSASVPVKKQSVIKKPSRSLGSLKRPSAKLMNGNRNNHNQQKNNNNSNNNQLSGKKRMNNPCQSGNDQSIQPPAKKRNPFSCNDNGKGGSNNFSDRKKKSNSIFSL